MKKDDTFEEIRKVCGGGEEANFVKHPLTEEEISQCVDRIGCVSLQNIAYHRRKIKL